MSEDNMIYETNLEQEEIPVYEGEVENPNGGKGNKKGAGIASMICGIVSLVGCCGAWYVSIPCAIAAIILGIVQCKKNKSKGMAIAGFICGGIGIIMSIVMLAAAVALINSGMYEEIIKELM